RDCCPDGLPQMRVSVLCVDLLPRRCEFPEERPCKFLLLALPHHLQNYTEPLVVSRRDEDLEKVCVPLGSKVGLTQTCTGHQKLVVLVIVFFWRLAQHVLVQLSDCSVCLCGLLDGKVDGCSEQRQLELVLNHDAIVQAFKADALEPLLEVVGQT